MKEITYEELTKLKKDSYVLIDIRDEGLRAYGTIPGALAMDPAEDPEGFKNMISEIPVEKKLILYCEIGRKSRELDEDVLLPGRDCYSLEGGYIAYVRSKMTDESAMEEKKHRAEESIRKKYHKQLFTPFAKA